MNDDISLYPKTIFCDIDGVLLYHVGSAKEIWTNPIAKLLPGVTKKFAEWEANGCKIILTTGRRECMRAETEAHLKSVGIFYDQLVMDVGRGIRVLVNDLKPYTDEPTAVAVCVKRNEGLKDVQV